LRKLREKKAMLPESYLCQIREMSFVTATAFMIRTCAKYINSCCCHRLALTCDKYVKLCCCHMSKHLCQIYVLHTYVVVTPPNRLGWVHHKGAKKPPPLRSVPTTQRQRDFFQKRESYT